MAFWALWNRVTHPLSVRGGVSPSPQPGRSDNKTGAIVPQDNRSSFQFSQPLQPDGAACPPKEQRVLLLHAPRQKYMLENGYRVPSTQTDHEMLVKVTVIGLNPIDWKAPDYKFGITQLPFISGRDLVGEVIKAPKASSRVRPGNLVIVVSTDYRDLRKAAYQEYAIATEYNACRLPLTITKEAGATLGVAFVTAAVALGVCLGVEFSQLQGQARGPDLLKMVRGLSPACLSDDVKNECLSRVGDGEAVGAGDWIAIWGGSSTTAHFAVRLARLAGLRPISIVDVRKHGARLADRDAELLVDSHNPERAIEIVRVVTGGSLRFAIDTSGRETAALLLQTLVHGGEVHESTFEGDWGHLVGLTGLPREKRAGVRFHTVPIKVFHEVREVGEALIVWLEKLLLAGLVSAPDMVVADGGLDGVNDGLDRMRRGDISGQRLVVPIC